MSFFDSLQQSFSNFFGNNPATQTLNQSQTQTTSPNPWAMQNYMQLAALAQAQQQQQYNPYPGELVAGLNPLEGAGLESVNAAQGIFGEYAPGASRGLLGGLSNVAGAGQWLPGAGGMIGNAANQYGQSQGLLGTALPYYDAGAGYASSGAGSVTPTAFSDAQMSKYLSPYNEHVIDATMANIQRNNAIQSNNLTGNAIKAGNAFGGDRAGVAQAELARNQDLASNQTIAGLENQNYAQALGEFNAQQGVDLGAQENNMMRQQQAAQLYGMLGSGVGQLGGLSNAIASGYGSLGGLYGQLAGVQGQLGATQAGIGTQIGQLGALHSNNALNAANAQLQGGKLWQDTQTAQDQAAAQQWMQAQAYPFQTLSWLSPFLTGTGALSGSTTTGNKNSVQTSTPANDALKNTIGIAGTVAGALVKRGGRIPHFAQGGLSGGGLYGGLSGYVPAPFAASPQMLASPALNWGDIGSPKADDSKQKADSKGTDALGKLIGKGLKGILNGDNTTGSPFDLNAPGIEQPGDGYGDGESSALGGDSPAGYADSAFGSVIYKRGGLVPGYADAGSVPGADDSEDYWTVGDWFDKRPMAERALLDELHPSSRPPETEPVRGGIFGGLGYKPMGWDDGKIPVVPPSAGGLPPEITGAPDAELPSTALGFDQPRPAPPGGGLAGGLRQIAEPAPAGIMPSGKPSIGRDIGAELRAFGAAMLGSPGNLASGLGAGFGAAEGARFAREHMDDKPVLDHSGPTTRIFYPSAGWIDTGLPTMTAAQKATNTELGRHHKVIETLTDRQRAVAERHQALELTKPVKIGMTPDGLDIMAIPDPMNPDPAKRLRIIDPTTGRFRDDGTAPPAVSRPTAQQGSPANGTVVFNSEIAQDPYDYSKDAPYMEKGMEVPPPQSISGKSARALQTDAEYYLQTGKLPPAARGRNPAAIQMNNYRNAVQNYAGAIAESRGVTPEQTAEMWRTAPGMLRFILGADGRSTVSLGTAVRHLDTLKQLAEAWQVAASTGNFQTLNRIKANVAREFGNDAVTNLESAARIVAPEIIKAIGVAGAGTEHDRSAALSAFTAATSPAQMLGAIQTTQKLMGGQLEGRKRQAMNAGVSEERFKSLIGDRPYELLTNIDRGHAPIPLLSPTDQRALDWARANPNDPRAAQIRQRLGVP